MHTYVTISLTIIARLTLSSLTFFSSVGVWPSTTVEVSDSIMLIPLIVDGVSSIFGNDDERLGCKPGWWPEGPVEGANIGEGLTPPDRALASDIAENSDRAREASAEANVGRLEPALLDGPREGGLDSWENCVKFGLLFTCCCVVATAAATAAAPALVPALRSHMSLRYPMTDLKERWYLSRCFCSLSTTGLVGPAVLA